MSIHYLEANAMLARALDYLAEAHGIYARHVANRKVIDDEGNKRLDLLIAEVDAISEKLQEINTRSATGWPGWALDEIADKNESLKFGIEVLEQRYIELF